MIYEEERTIDEMIDDIVRTGNEDESVREEKTEAVGDGQDRWDIPGEGTVRATCRRCGGLFLKPPKSKRTICPACFSASVSASMKASHAKRRERREAAAAASAGAVQEETGGRPMVAPTTGAASAGPSRLPPTGAAARPEENETHLYPTDELLAKWEALKEAEDTSSEPPEPEPPERAPESHPREAREVLMDLYGTVRNLARAAGLDPSRTIEALWEVDSILGNVGRA